MNDLGLKPAVATATIVKAEGASPAPAGNSPKTVMAAVKQGGYDGLAGNLAVAKREVQR